MTTTTTQTPKTVPTTWEVWTYDVWGNAEDGWDVNDRFNEARDYPLRLKVTVNNPSTPREFLSASPTDYQLGVLFGTGRTALETEGDDVTIYVRRARDGYPLGELTCTSHESLSPIRAAAVAATTRRHRTDCDGSNCDRSCPSTD